MLNLLKQKIYSSLVTRIFSAFFIVVIATLGEGLLRRIGMSDSLLFFNFLVLAGMIYVERWSSLFLGTASLQFFIGHSNPQSLAAFWVINLLIYEAFARMGRELELRTSELQVELDNRHQFTTVLAQHLKKPVNLTRMGTQFLKDHDSDTEKFKKAILVVAQQNENIDQIITDILNVSNLASGRGLDLVFRDHSLRTLVHEAIAPFEEQASGCFDLDINSAGGLAGWNEDGIKKIVRTLCSNALKFSNGKPIKLHLFEDDDHAYLSIKNHGDLLNEKAIRDIFSPFKLMLENKGDGLGLSLTLTKGIVEAHGGNLKVVSNILEGTVFQILLPKKRQERRAF